MWLITNFGFFSVVQKPDDPKLGTLTVRSRVLEDLESLKEQYFKQTMGEIQVNAGTDYKYRAKVPREAMAGAMSQIIMDLDYCNLKSQLQKIKVMKEPAFTANYGKHYTNCRIPMR